MSVINITSADAKFRSFENFCRDHPEGHFFQSGRFYKFIDGIDNYSPLLLIQEDETGEIRGSLLAVFQADNNRFLRFFSSGIIIRGGPLLDQSQNKREEILSALLEKLVSSTKKHALILQFRNFSDQSEFRLAFKKFGFRLKDHQNLITPTVNEQEAWKQLKQNRKRQIKKSLQNGAAITQDPSPDEFRQFYKILLKLYKSRVHKPLPSWRFFEKFYNDIFMTSSGIIHLIKYGNDIIGGIMCPVSEKKMVHEWYVCGLDREYREKGVYPSVLATWSAIEYASKNGIAAFDFMGLGKPDKYYGVRDFKLKFGGNLVNYGRFERINHGLVYFITRIGYNLLTLLNPLWIRKNKL